MTANTTTATPVFTMTATDAGSKGTLYTVTKDGEVWATRTSKRAYQAIAVALTTSPRYQGATFVENAAHWSIVGYAGTQELAAKAMKAHQNTMAAAAKRVAGRREDFRVDSPMVITLEG